MGGDALTIVRPPCPLQNAASRAIASIADEDADQKCNTTVSSQRPALAILGHPWPSLAILDHPWPLPSSLFSLPSLPALLVLPAYWPSCLPDLLALPTRHRHLQPVLV